MQSRVRGRDHGGYSDPVRRELGSQVGRDGCRAVEMEANRHPPVSMTQAASWKDQKEHHKSERSSSLSYGAAEVESIINPLREDSLRYVRQHGYRFWFLRGVDLLLPV